MPELPEVETIRRTLFPIVRDVGIKKIIVNDIRLRRPIRTRLLQKWLQGHRIVNITRRAKYLIFQFDNKAILIVHLGMSGRFQVAEPEDSIEKHTHVIFKLSNGRELRYRDPRRFGFIELLEPDQLSHFKPLQNLGVEPLSRAFSSGYLKQVTIKSKRAIKSVLMDARVVVGLGNIYVNESLFLAGIHPLVTASHLDDEQLKLLVQSIQQVLRDAIKQGGTTLNDFRNGTGEPGFFQMKLRVYGRHGQPCLNCGSLIERVVLTGRSTYFCPNCQMHK